jgi:hypothetical protein
VTVLIAALMAGTARSHSDGATFPSPSRSSAEVAPESDELQAPSSLPEAAPQGGSFGFGSGGS